MKFNFLYVTIVAFFFPGFCSGQPNMKSAEEEIYAVSDAFLKEWNGCNPKALAAFYTEDAMRVGVFGDVQHGPAEIEAAYNRLLNGPMKGSILIQEKGSIRMLSENLAVKKGAMEVLASDKTSMKGYVIEVFKKVDGRWLIIESHPKFFPPPLK